MKTLVQLMPTVFTGALVVGEGLELLFIKAMCIIDYIYTYIASFIMLLSCVCRVLVFVAGCCSLISTVFVYFYYQLRWRMFC